MLWHRTLAAVACSIAAVSAVAADTFTLPPLPSNLAVPAGQKLFSIARATGTQNYVCLPSTTGVSWTHHGPQATLYGERDEQVMTHFLSGNPAENYAARAAWQHSRDSSAIWAVAIASSTDPSYVADGAVSWLLLRVVGAQYGPGWGDRLTRTTFIQRINTAGGVAPAAGCALPHDVGKRVMVPYTTDYAFYRQ